MVIWPDVYKRQVPAQLAGKHGFFQGASPDAGVNVHVIQGNAVIHIHDDRLHRILHVEFLGKAGHKTDRELQALGLMDAHDADGIRIFILHIGLSLIHIYGLFSIVVLSIVKQGPPP